jgi:hypothetical protein
LRAGFNQSASSAQTNPNKTKQKSLDLLGFIRPNRGFSKGYKRKNKKNRLASQVVCKTSQTLLFSVLRSAHVATRAFDPANTKSVAQVSEFRKLLLASKIFTSRGSRRAART